MRNLYSVRMYENMKIFQLLLLQVMFVLGLQWKLPSQLLICDDPMVREVISNSLLRKHLGLEYLHRDVAARLNPHMLQSLGVQSLTTQHLIEVGKSIVTNLSSKESDGLYLVTLLIARAN